LSRTPLTFDEQVADIRTAITGSENGNVNKFDRALKKVLDLLVENPYMGAVDRFAPPLRSFWLDPTPCKVLWSVEDDIAQPVRIEAPGPIVVERPIPARTSSKPARQS